MNVQEWLAATSVEERRNVLTDVGTTLDYLYQISGGHRKPGVALARALEAATTQHTPTKIMTAAELRPDVYGEPAIAQVRAPTSMP